MTAAASTSQNYLPPGLPAPAISPSALDAPYWEGTRQHRLMVQTCAACGKADWPPEEICSGCHSFDRAWLEAAGTGTIYAWTRVWHPVHPALRESGPYIVVVVELDDFRTRVVGNLLGDPEQPVEMGMPVRATFEDQAGGEYALVQWSRM